ncbi:hypothetical protein Aduo_011754 [Ancylostoma duodenale]
MFCSRRCFTPVLYLVLSKLVADGLEMSAVMMLLVASQLIFGEWMPPEYRPVVGYLALSLQYSSFHTSIAMTTNRLLALLFPLRYNILCTNKTTVVVIVICWLIAWFHNLIYLKPECSFTFDPQIRKLVFTDDTCGEILSLYKDLIYNVVLALLTMIIDIFSLVKLRSQSSKSVNAPGRLSREKPWFLQATINSSLYVLMLTSFHTAHCFSGFTTHVSFF